MATPLVNTKVIFDARHIINPYTGLGRYTYCILTGLLKSKLGLSHLIILLDKNQDYSDSLFFHQLQNIIHKLPTIEIIYVDAPIFSLKHYFRLHLLINKYKDYLYFYPHFDLPFGIKSTAYFVIHDLFPLVLKKYFIKKTILKKLFFYVKIYTALKKKNIRCITVSKTTKSDVEHYFNGINNDIKIVYECSVIGRLELSNDVQPFKKKPLPHKYLLYVGDRRPHKNLPFLVTVFEALKKEFDYNGELLIIGSSTNYSYDLDNLVKDHKAITLLGNITDTELERYMQNMDALFFPSLYEGFGLPIVEAARFYKKIICSDIPVMKEVSPPWALFIDPTATNITKEAQKINTYLTQNIDTTLDYGFNKRTWEQVALEVFTIITDVPSS